MPSKSDRRAWISEHNAIYEALTRTAKLIDRWTDGVLTDRRRKRLSRDLEKLQSQLEEHFQREERGGLLDRLRRQLPEESHKLDRLQMEHDDVRRRLDALRASLDEGEPLEVDELSDEVEDLVEVMFRHETVEEQLAARALSWEVPQRA